MSQKKTSLAGFRTPARLGWVERVGLERFENGFLGTVGAPILGWGRQAHQDTKLTQKFGAQKKGGGFVSSLRFLAMFSKFHFK